jgi:hypothetical protein
MFEFEFAALFALTALLVAGSIAGTLRQTLPLIKGLQSELAACPETIELRFTITETVARWNDDTVVPLRPRQPRPAQQPGVRAAA